MIGVVVLGGVAAFVVAYFTYGRFLSKLFDMGGDRPTPAHTLQDGIDYHPARTPVLVGHHFSSIAGAGPIAGPVIATVAFGWLPAVLWIVLGAIFIGAVHDYGALAVSVKHRARSIAEVTRRHMSPLAHRLLLAFIWLTLVYVLVVFLDLTAATFAPRIPAGMSPDAAAALVHRGGGVASSSIFFIVLALLQGTAVYRFNVPLWMASVLFVPLVFVGLWGGQQAPLAAQMVPTINGSATTTWSVVLLAYCLAASVMPVWVLLQPRDYLSSFLLYACLGLGLVGIVASLFSPSADLSIHYPAFLGMHSEKLGFLFPALFINIACGACSGFHSVVASGTTAKQLDRERDARTVGYGSMLLEGVLALLAVATVAVLTLGSPETKVPPTVVFSAGLGKFLALIGIPHELANSFGMLAVSTFLLTTLDTATRLGRYILEELLNLKGKAGLWIATLATLALPLGFTLMTFTDAAGKPIPVWRLIWPVFGSTNQLLGALALLVISVWLKKTGRPIWYTFLPMVLMASATMLSLAQLVWMHGATLIGIIAAALFVLAVILIVEAMRSLLAPAQTS